MKYRVVFTTPHWHLNGVNTVSASLVRAMRSSGVDAEILLTDSSPRGFEEVPLPPSLPIRRLRHRRTIRRHLAGLIEDLSSNPPTVYLPGYDYRHSGVSPVLPNDVIAVGVVHGDDEHHMDHVRRLGDYWNAIVCVSRALEDQVREAFPPLGKRILTIHNGVDVPPPRSRPAAPTDRPLEIVWAGRVDQLHKRAFDLALLADGLHRRGTRARLSIIGGGPCLAQLRSRVETHTAAGRVRILGVQPNSEVLRIFSEADIFVLTSDKEGLPMSLLEAMARGCVPVVTDIRSGMADVVVHGQNGLILPVGDMGAFAAAVDQLSRSSERLSTLADAARATVERGGFDANTMTERYAALFERLIDDVQAGRFARPRGAIQLPWRPTLRDRLSQLSRRLVTRRETHA